MISEKLKALAFHSWNGASNPLALINSLPAAIEGMSQDDVRKSLEIKVIVGQLAFLLGEALGPSEDTVYQWTALEALTTEQKAKLAELNATDAQILKYAVQGKRWETVSLPYPLFGGDGCIMVDVTGAASGAMTLGIEKDGYTHS